MTTLDTAMSLVEKYRAKHGETPGTHYLEQFAKTYGADRKAAVQIVQSGIDYMETGDFTKTLRKEIEEETKQVIVSKLIKQFMEEECEELDDCGHGWCNDMKYAIELIEGKRDA